MNCIKTYEKWLFDFFNSKNNTYDSNLIKFKKLIEHLEENNISLKVKSNSENQYLCKIDKRYVVISLIDNYIEIKYFGRSYTKEIINLNQSISILKKEILEKLEKF
jgi:hypothetical protein